MRMKASGEIIDSISQTKNVSKEKILLDIHNIKENITSEISIPEDDIASSFKQMYSQAQKCIMSDWIYFETY